MFDAPADVLDARALIEKRIEGQTLVTSLAATVRAHGAESAYSDQRRSDGGWRTVTWREVRDGALDVASALIAAGIEPGDRVCTMATNRIEHILADAGVLHAGAIPISVYLTLSPSQVLWYARHSRPAAVILEGAEQLRRWELALADDELSGILKVVVVIESSVEADAILWDAFVAGGRADRLNAPEVVEARASTVHPDQAATILYTSGTTGDPKGVVLTHRNVLYECEATEEAADLPAPGVTVSYLPLAHIAERALSLYMPQRQSGHVHLIADPAQLLGALGHVRPTRFFGVPRVWEKIMAGITAMLAAETDETKKATIAAAMDAGRAYVSAAQFGETPDAKVSAAFERYDAAVLTPIRAILGLDRVEWTASAAAPMPVEVARFFAGLGLRIFDAYGMTETTASVSSGTASAFRLGTVGRALPGVELSLAGDGEILVRGPLLTPGYYENPEATAELIDTDDWLHTGDIGELDESGFLRIVDRKKEMIITSSGKNIAPSLIENYLKESPLVGHAMVVGEGRPYLVALITLDGDMSPLIAQRLGLTDSSLAQMASNAAIVAAVQEAVDAANQRLSRPEQVKKFAILPQEWTADSAELTPTLKIKRRVVSDKYGAIIDDLYSS